MGEVEGGLATGLGAQCDGRGLDFETSAEYRPKPGPGVDEPDAITIEDEAGGPGMLLGCEGCLDLSMRRTADLEFDDLHVPGVG